MDNVHGKPLDSKRDVQQVTRNNDSAVEDRWVSLPLSVGLSFVLSWLLSPYYEPASPFFFLIWCLIHFQLAHAFYHDTSHDLDSPEVEGQCGIKTQSMDSRFHAGTAIVGPMAGDSLFSLCTNFLVYKEGRPWYPSCRTAVDLK